MKVARIDAYPELKDQLAELTADGVSQTEIAKALGVKDRGTVAEWQKRPEIQARVSEILRNRCNTITRHTTRRIEGLLNSGKEISLENILKIHREFAGSTLNINHSDADAGKAMEELMMAVHDDPALAAAVDKLKTADNDED